MAWPKIPACTNGANVLAGRNFDHGHVSVFVNYVDRSALLCEQPDFPRYDDLRPLFADYADSAGIPVLDRRAANTPLRVIDTWCAFGRPVVRSNSTAVTNAAGAVQHQ